LPTGENNFRIFNIGAMEAFRCSSVEEIRYLDMGCLKLSSSVSKPKSSPPKSPQFNFGKSKKDDKKEEKKDDKKEKTTSLFGSIKMEPLTGTTISGDKAGSFSADVFADLPTPANIAVLKPLSSEVQEPIVIKAEKGKLVLSDGGLVSVIPDPANEADSSSDD